MTTGPLLSAFALLLGRDPAVLLAELRERARLWREAACRANLSTHEQGEGMPPAPTPVRGDITSIIDALRTGSKP